jgi:hypothetical protein
LKDWKHLVLNSLTLALTPALSPGERENSFPRIGNMFALDPLRFGGSMREFLRGILSPEEREKRSQRFDEVQLGLVQMRPAAAPAEEDSRFLATGGV